MFIGGYLHEFPSENQITPERTFYIPSTTIIPSVDINHLSQELDDPDTELTFEICRPSTNILQKDKVTIFKTTSTQNLVEWCSLLIQVSTGMPVEVPVSRSNSVTRKPSLNGSETSSVPSARNKVTFHEDGDDIFTRGTSPILEDNESGIIDDYFSKEIM
jgi:hypothetical protein